MENEVVLHDLGGSGPVLLFMHANGFHGRSYLPLAAALPNFHCFGMDFNGHGDAVLVPDHLNPFDIAHAAAAMIKERGIQGCFCFGHSMGGLIAPLLESLYPGTFSAIFLFDPTFAGPSDQQEYHSRSAETGVLLQKLVRNRRTRFPSLQHAKESLRKKPPFSEFHPDSLDCYLEHGLRPTTDGEGVQLKCAPSTEVAVFEAWKYPPTPDVKNIICPVFIATAAPDEGPHRFLPLFGSRIAAHLPCGQHNTVPPLSHFGPMEDPHRIATMMDHFLSGVLLGRYASTCQTSNLMARL